MTTPSHRQPIVAVFGSSTVREPDVGWREARVLGHELNNSLAPIKSVADSLATLLSRENLPSDWRDDTNRGLAVIGARADALGRFTSSYARSDCSDAGATQSPDDPALARKRP